MKKAYIIPILAFFLLWMSGCSRTANAPSEQIDEGHEVESVVEQEEPKAINPLTGLFMTKDREGRRPIAVMIENEKKARPQSGLDKADVVYEVLAEGGITRFLAIYLGVDAQEIGPVRSARPYFIDFAMEYDPIYVHYGGSPQAYLDLKRNSHIAHIDGIYDDVTFWRDKSRKAPHNAYTSTENIVKTAEKRGFLKTTELSFWDFAEETTSYGGLAEFELKYSGNYRVKYVYDERKKVYIRQINGEPHIDRITGDPIAVKNILILFMDTRVIDSEGRLEIKTTGSGTGYYVSCGKSIPIKWEKSSRFARAKYTDQSGEEIKLIPGNTWIQVMPLKAEVYFNLVD